MDTVALIWVVAVFLAIFAWEVFSQIAHRRDLNRALTSNVLHQADPDHHCAVGGISEHARAVAEEQAELHHCSMPAWINTVIETSPDNLPNGHNHANGDHH
jgi:hypothetical protein